MAQLISAEFSRVKSPMVLCIGGTESLGVAGLSVDQRTLSAMGVHCLPVVTAVTAQPTTKINTSTASVAPTSMAMIEAQLHCAADVNVSTIKIGLIANDEQAHCIAAWLQQHKRRQASTFVVYDPVSSSSHQQRLNTVGNAARTRLLQQCDLITPNNDELQTLTGHTATPKMQAAQQFFAKHGIPLVAKGGHDAENEARDIFVSQHHCMQLVSRRHLGQNVRGTGCCFAAAIAGAIALGHRLSDAIVVAKMMMQRDIATPIAVGTQHSMAPREYPRAREDLPSVHIGHRKPALKFPACKAPLGLYPIVDSAAWCQRLAALGVKTLQLRCKALSGILLRQEIRAAITVARQYDVQLFINDHWQLAMELGAYGVHLGQEDVLDADLTALQHAGLRLGISTHCLWEVAQAMTLRPSYIACGPIFPTTSKAMPWQAQGVAGFRFWRELIDLPLVAIGGIRREHIGALTAAGADGIAMISTITQADDPDSETLALLAQFSAEKHCDAV